MPLSEDRVRIPSTSDGGNRYSYRDRPRDRPHRYYYPTRDSEREHHFGMGRNGNAGEDDVVVRDRHRPYTSLRLSGSKSRSRRNRNYYH